MNREKFSEIVSKLISTSIDMDKFDKYKDLLIEENKKYNLTSFTEEEIYEKFFLNSIYPYLYLDWNNKKVLDIGTGAGAPGVILKIIFPSINLTLLDSNNKKIEFLKKLSTELSLNNIEFISGRAEDWAYKLENHFDIVVSRAVTDIRKGVEISSRFIKINGYYLPLKSNKYLEEILEAENTIKKLNFVLEKTEEYKTEQMRHYLPFLKKNNMTPKGIPRDWKDILKKDL